MAPNFPREYFFRNQPMTKFDGFKTTVNREFRNQIMNQWIYGPGQQRIIIGMPCFIQSTGEELALHRK